MCLCHFYNCCSMRHHTWNHLSNQKLPVPISYHQAIHLCKMRHSCKYKYPFHYAYHSSKHLYRCHHYNNTWCLLPLWNFYTISLRSDYCLEHNKFHGHAADLETIVPHIFLHWHKSLFLLLRVLF